MVIGTIFLAVCLWRVYLGHFTTKQHLGFEFAAWYWHFVDVVWLFLFAAIYVYGYGGLTFGHTGSPYEGRRRRRPFTRFSGRSSSPWAHRPASEPPPIAAGSQGQVPGACG